MSETEETPKPKPAPVEPLGDDGKKALETERKERRALEKQLKELQEAEQKRLDAEKTEIEKLKDEAESAKREAAELKQAREIEKLRREVAVEKQIANPDVLHGATREELEAHADLVKSLIPEIPKLPDADDAGAGDRGEPIGDKELSVEDIVNAATDHS